MIFLENRTDRSIDTVLLQSLADELTHRDVELILCDDPTIAELNRTHRGKAEATDVLSFPLEGELEHQPLGAVVISVDHALAKADTLGHTLDEEIALLFIHGLLHLLGYDHETDTGQMRAEEHALLRAFGLPESLIVRTEES
jgi:probable rRNA maturation factor